MYFIPKTNHQKTARMARKKMGTVRANDLPCIFFANENRTLEMGHFEAGKNAMRAVFSRILGVEGLEPPTLRV